MESETLMQTRLNALAGLLLITVLSSTACAAYPLSNERSTNVSEGLNPIAQLNQHSIERVSIEPMVVNRNWVELRGDGSTVVFRSSGPAGRFGPRGSCALTREEADSLVDTLSRAQVLGAAPAPVVGDFLVRIQTTDGETLTARIPGIDAPETDQVPAVVIGNRHYRLEEGDINMMRRLIAGTIC